VFGISVVRNEVNIVRLTLLNHLALGLDRILVLDNGSTDGTRQVLSRLACDPRVRWIGDQSPFLQARMTTELAREAFRQGADWFLPFDADEFWYCPEGLMNVLAQTRAGALACQVVTFVQRRDQRESAPDALLHMTRRAVPVGTPEQSGALADARDAGYVETRYPPKCITRATATLEIQAGNHVVTGLAGPLEPTNRIALLHAPLRDRGRLTAKVEYGRRTALRGLPLAPAESWHLLRRWRLAQAGELAPEWAANSFDAAGCLDVYGRRHPVVVDTRLRDVVRPWITVSLQRRLLRLIERRW
jgi:glycosyltransferase involved in cell wall biosynthesis